MSSFWNFEQIKDDAWTLAQANPYVAAYNIYKIGTDIKSGDYESAKDRSERGITGIAISGAVGLGLAYPSAAFRVLNTAHKVHPNQSIPGYGPVDYVMDLKGERDRNDLEAQDFLFYALPEVAQIAIKRWTLYDMPPEVQIKLVSAELQKISIPTGKPSKRPKSSRSKSKKKTTKKGSTGGPKYCKIHKKFDFCYRK